MPQWWKVKGQPLEEKDPNLEWWEMKGVWSVKIKGIRLFMTIISTILTLVFALVANSIMEKYGIPKIYISCISIFMLLFTMCLATPDVSWKHRQRSIWYIISGLLLVIGAFIVKGGEKNTVLNIFGLGLIVIGVLFLRKWAILLEKEIKEKRKEKNNGK